MTPLRKLGPFEVSTIGLGCMNISHAYGTPPSPEQGAQLLLKAYELGITLFDTAALYGFGSNEELVGKTLKSVRNKIVLTSKGGLFGQDGKRILDGRPETLRKNCEDSLRRLQTDVIDLYYLHRWDKAVPVEDSVGELAKLLQEGKIRSIGLSEVSAPTIRKAQAVHPIAAVQTEYSLWTRNPEIAVLNTCHELGITFVAFSPLARGYLGGKLLDVTTLEEKDIRRHMPRFYPENYPQNLRLIPKFQLLANEVGCTMPQLALAWVLNKDKRIVPIPGTTKINNLIEDLGASSIQLSKDVIDRLDALFDRNLIAGLRYNEANQREVDTEEY
jgi:aryl-alcohol dehydrogenase-like predicted oxidoreductase